MKINTQFLEEVKNFSKIYIIRMKSYKENHKFIKKIIFLFSKKIETLFQC